VPVHGDQCPIGPQNDRSLVGTSRLLIQDASNDTLINCGPESQIDLFGNMWTSLGRIALFHLDNPADQIGCVPFRTGLSFLLG
jgi:hypothetical protein